MTKQRNGRAQFGWHFKLQEIEVWRDGESGHSESACTVEHLDKTEDKLTFGSSKVKRKRLGKNQEKLKMVLEQEYLAGVACWEPEGLRQLANTTFTGATRSTIHSAIEGMTNHGVLTQPVEGKHYLMQPPKRRSPARMEAVETIQ